MNLSQKALLYFFISIYIIICPLAILYTFGYLDPKPSSSIYIKTDPGQATVYMGKSRYLKKTPLALENLYPGRYHLTLELEGYLPIHYRVYLRPNTEVKLDKVVFRSEKLKAKRLNTDNYQNLIDISSDDYFILSYGNDYEDYGFYDFSHDRMISFSASKVLPWGSDILDITTMENSSDLIIKANALGQIKYVYLKPLNNSLISKDITELFIDEPEHIEWDPDYPQEIFTFQNNFINRIDLASGKPFQRYFEDCIGYTVYNGSVFVVSDILSLKRYDYEKSRLDMLINDPVLGKRLFEKGRYFKVQPLFTTMILFLGDRGDLSLNKAPHKFVEQGVKGFKFDRQLKRLLFWQDKSIGILDLGMRGSAFVKIPKVVWIFEGAQKIEQAYWANGGSHVLFRDDNGVFLFELKIVDTSRLNPLQPVVKVKENSSIYYSDVSGTLFYLEPGSGNLINTKIIPSPAGDTEQ
ncbi:MAG: PEGA domain-containing protein [Candidatus Omnitrophica bacterium]|nr:PEGA domain-containing protein [Candidatus Omnitrophota bacterium]